MGKPKGKTSKVKLGNKASNKKTNKNVGANKYQEKFQSAKIKAGKFKKKPAINKKELMNGKIDYSRYKPEDDHDVDDMLESDEEDDMKSYLKQNANDMSFLSKSLDKNSDGMKSYEAQPRSYSNVHKETDLKDDRVDLLPIKGATGLIRRKGERIEEQDNENEDGEGDGPEENDLLPIMEKEPMSVIEILAAHREQVVQKKLQIAQLSMDIVENPYEKISQLKHLLKLAEKDEPLTIRKLALLSMLEIFKDIIPSYNIRELSDDEQNAKVSRDVKKIRDYEQNLLKAYQRYLQSLEENIKVCKKFVKKSRGSGAHHEKQKKSMASLVITSMKCLAELIKNLPHFNFRKNIINVLIPNIELSQDLEEAGQICSKAIKETLLADYNGYIALDVVTIIQNLAKSKPTLSPLVLETLLCLRVDADLVHATEEKGNKIERLKAKREAIKKMSRKERKRKKVEDKLNQELQEVEAVESRDKIGKTHTEILKRLFVIYFRVLKLGFKSDLLGITLRGLARFSHLINIDFFGDLMNCLETVLKYEDLDTQDRLHCILTAMKVLSGQGEALTIDPRQFYTELYNVLLNFDSEIESTCFDSVRHCLEIMLIKRRKQVSHPQILGFLKRLSTMLLQMPIERSSDMFLLLRSIFQLYEKCDYLLDNENFGRGVFQPDITNPEHSNADSTALWELQLLSRFYQNDAELYCKHVMIGAPSHGPGSLPQRMLQRGASKPDFRTKKNAAETTDLDYFENLPERAQTTRKQQQQSEIKFKSSIQRFGNETSSNKELYEKVDNELEKLLKTNLINGKK